MVRKAYGSGSLRLLEPEPSLEHFRRRTVFPLSLALCLLLVACASRYHAGVHYLGNGRTATSVVSRETDKFSEPIEERALTSLTTNNLTALQTLMTPSVLNDIPQESWQALEEAIRNRFKFTRHYELMPLVNAGGRLDEALFENPFAYYDFVEARYLLYGNVNAFADLYLTEVDGQLKLSGFALRDADPKINQPFLMRYLRPETTDKAKITGRKVLLK
jgi:hypothetical protein